MSGGARLWELFSLGRDKDANAVAVQTADIIRTYEDMYSEALTLADLISRRALPETAALCMTKGPDLYTAYLALASLDASLVPFDPTIPQARAVRILEDSRASLLLTDSERVADAARVGCPWVDVYLQTSAQWELRPATQDATGLLSAHSNAAYVLFTSGSTGTPKGVPVHGRGVVSYVERAVDRYEVGAHSRLTANFSLGFDLSVFDMFVTFAGGARLCIPSTADTILPARYAAAFDLTHWFSVPSTIDLANRADGLESGSMPRLIYSIFCGEPLYFVQARAWARAAPTSVIENIYGPTEMTISMTSYRLPRSESEWPPTVNGTVPIGLPHEQLDTRIVPHSGEVGSGELWARGIQRFDGYTDPDQNASAFTDDRGNPVKRPTPDSWYRTGDVVLETTEGLLHLGRQDDQVKIMGYRIELGEIEARLRAIDGITSAAVVVIERTNPALVAFYTGDTLDETFIRQELSRELPRYMVPKDIRFLTKMPQGSTGKIDRVNLRIQAQ